MALPGALVALLGAMGSKKFKKVSLNCIKISSRGVPGGSVALPGALVALLGTLGSRKVKIVSRK